MMRLGQSIILWLGCIASCMICHAAPPESMLWEKLDMLMQENPIRVIHDFPHHETIKQPIKYYADHHLLEQHIQSKTIIAPIKITNSSLLAFSTQSSHMQEITYLNENLIKGKFSIYLSQFDKALDIKHTTVEDYFSIYRSLFYGRFNLSFSRIHGSSWISSTQFHDSVLFVNTQFMQDSHILNSTFEQIANYAYASFHHGMEFVHDTFVDNLILDGVFFNEKVSFRDSTFHQEASFNNTLLPRFVDFSHVKIKGKPINLNHARPNIPRQKIHINILQTDINKIDFNYLNFRLYFPPDTSHQQKLYLYSLLLKKFEKQGMTQSYEALYREYKAYQLLYHNRYLLNFIDKHWWDYGLHKEVIYRWFLALFIALTLINCFFYDALVSKYFNIHFLRKVKPNIICTINPILHYIYNIPRATLLTLFFVFATFLQVLTNEDRIFKSDRFLVNAYVIIINCLGYVFILFVFDSLLNQT